MAVRRSNNLPPDVRALGAPTTDILEAIRARAADVGALSTPAASVPEPVELPTETQPAGVAPAAQETAELELPELATPEQIAAMEPEALDALDASLDQIEAEISQPVGVFDLLFRPTTSRMKIRERDPQRQIARDQIRLLTAARRDEMARAQAQAIEQERSARAAAETRAQAGRNVAFGRAPGPSAADAFAQAGGQISLDPSQFQNVGRDEALFRETALGRLDPSEASELRQQIEGTFGRAESAARLELDQMRVDTDRLNFIKDHAVTTDARSKELAELNLPPKIIAAYNDVLDRRIDRDSPLGTAAFSFVALGRATRANAAEMLDRTQTMIELIESDQIDRDLGQAYVDAVLEKFIGDETTPGIGTAELARMGMTDAAFRQAFRDFTGDTPSTALPPTRDGGGGGAGVVDRAAEAAGRDLAIFGERGGEVLRKQAQIAGETIRALAERDPAQALRLFVTSMSISFNETRRMAEEFFQTPPRLAGQAAEFLGEGLRSDLERFGRTPIGQGLSRGIGSLPFGPAPPPRSPDENR